VRGILLDNGLITAQTVTVYTPPAPTATPVAIPATVDPAILSIIDQTPVTIVIQSPIQMIEDGRLWINGMSLDYDPDDPFFEGLQVGDVLRIEGTAVQVGDTQAINATNVTLIRRVSDEDDEDDEGP